jgi:O-acetylserine/cysteine efflux transporter
MSFRDILLALLVPILWGVAFTLAKPTVGHFPPLFTMAIAYTANLIMISTIWRRPSQTPFWSAALIAACCATIQGALIFNGYKHLSASVSNLVVQTQVPFAIVFGWLILGERMNSHKIVGTILALIGVILIVGLPRETPPIGPVFLIIGGAAVWALGQVFTRKLSRDQGPLILRALSLHAAPQLILASFLFEKNQLTSLFTASAFEYLSLGGFILIGFIVANTIWYTVVQRNHVNDVAPFTLLMPPVGLVAAWALLGETITLINAVGGLIIVLGVAIASEVNLARTWRLVTNPGIERPRSSA